MPTNITGRTSPGRWTRRRNVGKTTDSREKLAGRGLSFSCCKKTMCRDRGEEWENCFQSAACFAENPIWHVWRGNPKNIEIQDLISCFGYCKRNWLLYSRLVRTK